MSRLDKTNGYDLRDILDDTPQYFDDIFTIDNPEFDKHIPDLHLYINKTSVEQSKYFRRRNFFLDLNIKIIGSDIHNSIYNKRIDGFLIVNFPWLSGDVLRLPSYGI